MYAYQNIKKILHKYDNDNLTMIQNPIFGHLCTNILFRNPELQEQICNEISSLNFVAKIEVVRGYINIFLKPMNFTTQYSVVFEYASPNPTGPLHLGHIRNIFIGESCCRLLETCGYKVTREMYINDQGNQVNQFLASIQYYKTGQGNLYYKGDYVQQFSKYDDPLPKVIQNMRNDLKILNIYHDTVIYESKLNKEMEEVHKILQEKGLLFKGKVDENSIEENILINTISLGDDKNRVLQRENGTYTYFAYDLAYHYHKFQQGYDYIYTLLGEDHVGHMKKLTLVLNQMGINIKILSYKHVFYKDGDTLLALSKRQGNIITLRDLLQKFTANELRWIILSQSANKIIEFDEHYNLDTLHQVYLAGQRLQRIQVGDTPSILTDLIRYSASFSHILESACFMNDIHKIFEFLLKMCQEFLSLTNMHLSLNKNICSQDDYKIISGCLHVYKTSMHILCIDYSSV